MRGLALLALGCAVAGCGQATGPGDGGGGDSGSGTQVTPPVPDMVVPAGVEVDAPGSKTCVDPSLRAATRFDRRLSPSPPNDSMWTWAVGVIAGDFDGDGNLDMLTPSQAEAGLYWGTPAGSFVEADASAIDLSWGIGGTAVDYDGDDDLDLYVTRYSQPNVLLRNEGNRTFVDVTAEAGVACQIPDGAGGTKGAMSMASAWADFDRDGDLDLYVGNYGWVDHSQESASTYGPAEPDCLYVNNGDGTLTDATDALLPYETFAPLHDGYAYVAGWHDLDDDGWPELYVVNDFGTAFPNTLLWNDAGTLKLDNGLHGLDVPVTGMGLGVNDLNGDGAPDLVMPVWNNIVVLESFVAGGGARTWIDASDIGIQNDQDRKQKVGWGAEIDDMDNDADLDVVVAFGYVEDLGNPLWDNAYFQPDALYVNDGGYFTDQGMSWGVADEIVGRGFAVMDINRDGWQDLVKRDLAGPNVIYASRCGVEDWLEVELRQPGTLNTRAIGAKITLTEAGVTQIRWVRAGGTSHATGLPPEVHFGLGTTDGVIDTVEVRWPDGTAHTLEHVSPRQLLKVTRSAP